MLTVTVAGPELISTELGETVNKDKAGPSKSFCAKVFVPNAPKNKKTMRYFILIIFLMAKQNLNNKNSK